MFRCTVVSLAVLLTTVYSVDGARLGAPQSGDKVVCYYPNWSQYRPDYGRFEVADIDPFLCTHILYAFAKIQNGQLTTYERNDHAMYAELNQLKNQNPALKTLLSVGGATMGNGPFIDVSSTATKRAAFANNVVSYLSRHNFDGVDMDWEFPTAAEKDQYRELLGELRRTFQRHALLSGDPEYLLSCALSAARHHIHNSYDIPGVARYVDFANIMAYDLHGAWDPETGFHSALHGYQPTDQYTQSWVVEEYLSRGLPAGQAIMGIPTYGRSYTLCNQNDNGVRACSLGAGQQGAITQSPGILAYNEICMKLSSGWTRRYDHVQKGAYAYHRDQWTCYDDRHSIIEKAVYAKGLGLGGFMFWDLSMDDFGNQCGGGRYPLVKAVKSGGLETSTTQTTPSTGFTFTTRFTTRRTPRTTTVTPATTTTAPSGGICDGVEDLAFVRHPSDCSRYYQCASGTAHMFQCPPGLYFDIVASVCNWDYLVDC